MMGAMAGQSPGATNGAGSEDEFWSLEPLHKPKLPLTKTKGWAKSPIDLFILAKLEEEGMHPTEPAEKRDLLRRGAEYQRALESSRALRNLRQALGIPLRQHSADRCFIFPEQCFTE